MTKRIRYSALAIASVILITISAILFINYTVKNKVENFIATRLPATVINSYEDLSLNIVSGTLTYTNVSVAIKNKKTDSIHTKVTVDTFIIEEISYWDYLFQNEIHIEDIKLKFPVITYYKEHFNTPEDSSTTKPLLNLIKPVLIDELSIDNADVTIFEVGRKEHVLFAKNLTVEVDDILISSETLKRRLPLEFDDYEAQSDSIFLKVSNFENLSAKNFYLKHHQATLEDLIFNTNVSKKRLSEIIRIERDHFSVTLKKLTANNLDFGFNDRKFFAKSSAVTFTQPNATIYRDKLVADDAVQKKLYSSVLRELPIDLSIDSIAIEDGYLKYQERVKPDNSGGTIEFKKLNANILNAGNTYKTPLKTTISIQSEFMENTPIDIDWSFDVNDPTDKFLLKTKVGHLVAENLNDFTQPIMRVKLSGELHKVYMTMDGDRNKSHSDMKIDYTDFKVTILDNKGKDKNKLLSAIANIFIAKNSEKKDTVFREASVNVTPDKTKSFFNYIWLNVKQGLVESLVGRSKS